MNQCQEASDQQQQAIAEMQQHVQNMGGNPTPELAAH
jgi:hypothetical protein